MKSKVGEQSKNILNYKMLLKRVCKAQYISPVETKICYGLLPINVQ